MENDTELTSEEIKSKISETGNEEQEVLYKRNLPIIYYQLMEAVCAKISEKFCEGCQFQ